MSLPLIESALAIVPAGRWAVGVSGGADSVALLRGLVATRPDVELVVVHLDHQTRGGASGADAAFVADLAATHGLALCARRLDELDVPPLRNVEARFRRARQALFREAVARHNARGVLLAHHADDRAETTLLRLLRGGEPAAIAGLRAHANVGGLHLLRPLLGVRRTALEAYLSSIGQTWRTDATNAADTFARNRVRRFLATRSDLFEAIARVSDAAAALADWSRDAVPAVALDAPLSAALLADLPDALGRRLARAWLAAQGCPRDALSIEMVGRLIAMARDRASPGRQTFPGAVQITRRGGALGAVADQASRSRVKGEPDSS